MKSWYLTTPQPNITSGYESDVISEYAQSNFTDVLCTTFADTVLLYNCDLSECQEVNCVIQGNTADAQLKSMERSILFPIGTSKAGMYVFFENRYWLITGYPGNNKSYEKVTVVLCQYNLKWQLSNGNIVSRWVNITSASKYDVGENVQNRAIILTSNNYTILIGADGDAMELEEKRVFIDKNTKAPQKVYKITRNDDVLYDYGDEWHGSILSFIADKTELVVERDRPDLGICDYTEQTSGTSGEPSSPTGFITANMKGKYEMKIGLPKTYSSHFTDDTGSLVNLDVAWNVISDFEVVQQIQKNKITLCVNDTSAIGKTFYLQMLDAKDKTVISKMTVTVVEGI